MDIVGPVPGRDNIVHLRDLIAAGYTVTELHSWPMPEYRDEAGDVYYLHQDVGPWLDGEAGA
jgi:hypothetical protein